MTKHKQKIAILGTVGVPACYGGFETLAENLVRANNGMGDPYRLTVYCSAKEYPEHPLRFLGAKLRYIPLAANGKQSVVYDCCCLFDALCSDTDIILLLGVSGAIALPLVRLLSGKKIITNIDGMEWRRQKWQGIARKFLKMSEMVAIRFSHEVITDNQAIHDYVKAAYRAESHMIAYGGDHALTKAGSVEEYRLPAAYSCSVCRIEPENNTRMILEAFAAMPDHPLVMIGNWSNSDYGKRLRADYSFADHLHLLDPIYDSPKLAALRANARYYIHGHSAGGTNPSLVEAMHFGRPIFAFDCDFNRYTTHDQARYFQTADQLRTLLGTTSAEEARSIGEAMKATAQRVYTWATIAKAYFTLLTAPSR